MCIYNRLNPRLKRLGLGLLHLANISLTGYILKTKKIRNNKFPAICRLDF